MIKEDKYWINILPREELRSSKINGKWLYYGEKEFIHSLINKLDKLVSTMKLVEVKISKKKSHFEIFEELPAMLICFTEEGVESQNEVKKILKSYFNIDVKGFLIKILFFLTNVKVIENHLEIIQVEPPCFSLQSSLID